MLIPSSLEDLICDATHYNLFQIWLIRMTTTLSHGKVHKNILYSWDEQKVPSFVQKTPPAKLQNTAVLKTNVGFNGS